MLAGLTWASNYHDAVRLVDFIKAILQNWKDALRHLWRSVFEIIPIHIDLQEYQIDAISLIVFLFFSAFIRYYFKFSPKPIFSSTKASHFLNHNATIMQSAMGALKILTFLVLAGLLLSAFIDRNRLGSTILAIIIAPIIVLMPVALMVQIVTLYRKIKKRMHRLMRFGYYGWALIFSTVLKPAIRYFKWLFSVNHLKEILIMTAIIVPMMLVLGPVVLAALHYVTGREQELWAGEVTAREAGGDINLLDTALMLAAFLGLALTTLRSMRPLAVTVGVGIAILLFGAVLGLAFEAAEIYFYPNASEN
ncbi:MAG: hypothetical protein ACXIVO_05505 [Glycocaulis sp.]